MANYLGVDGGATKTEAVVGDSEGRLLGYALAGPSNYHNIGMEAARESIRQAIGGAAAVAAVDVDAISFAFLGLAGADRPRDFEVLDQAVAGILGTVPFRVANDSWAALRGGTRRNWGVVMVCGTGANAAGRNPEGQEMILRALGYEYGNRGGAFDIVRDALYYAFRSDEGAGTKTLLEREIPAALGLAGMDELADMMLYDKEAPARLLALAPLVFRLASEGDRVAQEVLISVGQSMGEAAGGIITRLGMAGTAVEVILSGSTFRGSNPLLIDGFTTALHRAAPLAYTSWPEFPPVVGAYLAALQQQGIALSGEVYDRIAGTWPAAAPAGRENERDNRDKRD